MANPLANMLSQNPDLFSPAPMTGQGAFGKVPGLTKVPDAAQRSINTDFNGMVSPEIRAKLQNEAARFGVSSGMPGSGLAANKYLHDYLGASRDAEDRGFKHYASLLPVAEQNAVNAAAPDPATRAVTEQSFAQQMFNQYLSTMRGAGSGGRGGAQPNMNPAGGTGVYAAPNTAPSAVNPNVPNRAASNLTQDDVDNLISGYINNPDSWMGPGTNAATPSNQSQSDVDAFIAKYLDNPDSWMDQ